MFKKYNFEKGLALFKRQTNVLGLDLGSASLKIVQLRKEKERAILETYGEIAAGPYAGVPVGKSARLLDKKVVEMLSDLRREANAQAELAAAAIPLRSSFVRLISMPLLSDKELAQAVPFEARKYIPVPASEVIIDWWLLPEGISSEGKESEGFIKERKFVEVLLVAIHREAIEKFRHIFKEAKLEVGTFEIEVFSQVRSILGREAGPVLLVDFGAGGTRFAVADYGIVKLTHTLDRGSLELTDALSRSLGVDFERAERLKQDIGLSARPEHKEVRGVIEPLLEHIFSEGLRVVTEYHRRSGRPVKKIWLAGGGSLLKGLVDFSVNKFGLEARLANPFQKVEYPAFLEETLREIGPIFATALGAALRALQE